ncbi:hypothetical protein [Geodermatophilus sp. SYSU D00698]
MTWTLHAAPFAVLAPVRDSAVVAALRRHVPLGVLGILAAHTLRDVPTGSVVAALPFVVAVAVTRSGDHRAAGRRDDTRRVGGVWPSCRPGRTTPRHGRDPTGDGHRRPVRTPVGDVPATR